MHPKSTIVVVPMVSLVLALTSGCGEKFASGPEGGAATGGTDAQGSAGGGGSGASTTAPPSGGSGGHGEGGAEPSCAAADLMAVADTAIFSSDCDGDNHFGTLPYANIGAGRVLLRFEVTDAVASILAEGGALSHLELDLSRDVDCLAGDEPCPATAGPLLAFPLRTDWDEGTSTAGQMDPRTGADWCRRVAGTSENEWASPGASGSEDRGDRSGAAQVDTTQSSVTVSLEPALHRSRMITDGNGGYLLAVLLEGDSDTRFVAATRENANETAPVLHIRACPAGD